MLPEDGTDSQGHPAARIDHPYLAHDIPFWFVTLGACYRQTGDFEKAKTELTEGTKSSPPSAARARELNHIMWCCFEAASEWGEAVDFYNALRAKWPSLGAEWHYSTALAYRRMGMKAEAVDSLERALAHAEGDFGAIKRIGPELTDAYQEVEKADALVKRLEQEYPGYAQYRRELEAAVEQRESTRQARVNLIYEGYAALAGERFEQAITLFQEYIDRYPKSSLVESAHICIAECLQRTGKLAAAISHLQQVYNEQPDLRACALYGQATVTFEDGQYQQTASALEKLLADHPDSSYARLKGKDLLAESYIRSGKVDQGVAVLRELVGSSDNEAKTVLLYRIGEACFDAQKWPVAVNAYDELISVCDVPGIDGKARYRAALCREKLGQPEQARTRMQQVVARYPKSMWAKQANEWLASSGGAGGAQ